MSLDYLRGFADAFSNPSFLALFFGFSLYTISAGVHAALNTHTYVFFWQFDSSDIAWLSATFVFGFFPGVMLARPFHARFDKKPTLIGSSIVAAVLFNGAVLLRLLDLAPTNDSPLVFWLIFGQLFGLAIVSGLSLTTAGSMMADVAQEHVYRTGKNQQGALFSVISFAGKATSGVGHAVAGIGLDWIQFPLKAEPSQVAPELIHQLGVLSLVSSVIGFLGLASYYFYRIDHSRHQETRAMVESQVQAPTAPSAQDVRGVA
jgi:Na+/melibiose symporter-like transporter